MAVHPLDTAFPTGVSTPPSKEIVRDTFKTGTIWAFDNAAEVPTYNLVNQRYLVVSNYIYKYDSTDTVSAHAPPAVLVSLDGKRFKPLALTVVADTGKDIGINGGCEIWQRGNTFGGSGWTCDRFYFLNGTGAVNSIQRGVGLTAGSRYSLYWDRSTVGSTESQLRWVFENVDLFTGKQITVSFDAEANGGAKVVYVRAVAIYGSGGAAASTVAGTPSSISIGTSVARYSFTLTVGPKDTLGTADTDYLMIQIRRLITEADGSIRFDNFRLDFNSVSSPFIPTDYGEEMNKCRRFYQTLTQGAAGETILGTGISEAVGAVFIPIQLPVPMRAIPTMTVTGNFAVRQGGTVIGSPTALTSVTPSKGTANIRFEKTGAGFAVGSAQMLVGDSDPTAALQFEAEHI